MCCTKEPLTQLREMPRPAVLELADSMLPSIATTPTLKQKQPCAHETSTAVRTIRMLFFRHLVLACRLYLGLLGCTGPLCVRRHGRATRALPQLESHKFR